MIPIRASATAVEAVRLFMEPDNEWMTLEALEQQILGQSPASLPMQIGTTFGALIETDGAGARDASGDFVRDGLRFDGASMGDVLARTDRRGLFEVKGTRQYGDVLVVAKADQLVGAQLVETKTTLGAFDFEKYAASAQWRLMCDIFAPSVITYRVALLGEPSPGRYAVKDLAEFNLFPYAELHRDCAALVAQFRAFVVARGLDGALRARQQRSEAAA